MGGLIEQPRLTEPEDFNWRPIIVGVAVVIVVMVAIAFLLRSRPKAVAPLHPYANKVQLSDTKMSAAENFVGVSVTYIDGTVTNTGDKTVTGATVHVIFKNSLGEVAQAEDVPLHVLQTGGPYPDAVNLRVAPLGPGQNKAFRLTFEHVSADWNHEFPELRVTDVSLK